MSLRIGILGTRGIPNHYGGFEQFASYLSKGLVELGHEVSVYNSHLHPYKQNTWNGVDIIHCYDPAHIIGTAGQFLYDLNCIIDARKKKFDILLVLGYTSSSIWGRWYPAKTIVITNMDGLEWKRTKYSKPVQLFLRYAEKLAVKFSHGHIADSIPIQKYLEEKYAIEPTYISYGATIPEKTDETILLGYEISPKEYFLVMARMEPENNIDMILEGVCKRQIKQKIVVIGNTENGYGKMLRLKFSSQKNVQFAGTIYDQPVLDTLRANCILYFHGHSVGGTNPSLLEVMAGGAAICAHDNVFNRAVLDNNAFYFSSADDIANILFDINAADKINSMTAQNLHKIREEHTWQKIINAYEELFIQFYQSRQ